MGEGADDNVDVGEVKPFVARAPDPAMFDEEFLLAVDEASAEIALDPYLAASSQVLTLPPPPPPGYFDEEASSPKSSSPASEARPGRRRAKTTRRPVSPTAVLGYPPVRRLVDPESGPLTAVIEPVSVEETRVAEHADASDEPTLEVDLEVLVRASTTEQVPLRFLRGERSRDAIFEDVSTRKASRLTLRGEASPLSIEQRAAVAGVYDGLDDDAEEWPVFPAERGLAAEVDGRASARVERSSTEPTSAELTWRSPLEEPFAGHRAPARSLDPKTTRGHSPLEAFGAGRSGEPQHDVLAASSVWARPLQASGAATPRSGRFAAPQGEAESATQADESATTRRHSVPRVMSAGYQVASPGALAEEHESATTRRHSVPRVMSAGYQVASPGALAEEHEDERRLLPRPRRAAWVTSGLAAAALLLFGATVWQSGEAPPAVASASLVAVTPAAIAVSSVLPVPSFEATSVTRPLAETPAAHAEGPVAASLGSTHEVGLDDGAKARPSRTYRRSRPVVAEASIPEEEPSSAIEDAPEPEIAGPAAARIPTMAPKTASSLMQDARSAFAREDYDAAFRFAMESRSMARSSKDAAAVTRLIVQAGCRAGQRDHALQALRQMPLLQRASMRRECRREGERLGL